MEIWTAFVIGFIGSVHCIGMCGPIAIALPVGGQSRLTLLISRVLYNLGRVVTYTALGVVSGLLGKTIVMAGFQQTLSIVLGVLILIAVAIRFGIKRRRPAAGLSNLFLNRVQAVWARLFSNPSPLSLLAIGLLNGFLPCGFVYFGLAAAAATGEVVSAMAYMALFGLGTVPIMLATSLLGRLVSLSVRQFISRLLPIGAVILAGLLIVRGLSLGIPYVSPKVNSDTEQAQEPKCH